MRKAVVQGIRTAKADMRKEKEEYGGSLSHQHGAPSGYCNSRNRPDVYVKFQSCYDDSSRDIKEIAKDAVELSGRALSGSRQLLQLKDPKQHFNILEGLTEFRENYKKLDLDYMAPQTKLGMLENNITKRYRIMASELQTVMAGVTRRFARSEATAMYHSIFHYGRLEPEEDFDHVRTQNDVVIALSYRHQGTNRMSESMFLHVLDNIFHAVHVMKPQVTHIRLWVDAVASRRHENRKWVSKGILPYTVFPVCVCDQKFSLRWNRTWINIETLLGLMGAGLMVFDRQIVWDMGLFQRSDDAEETRNFYFRGAQLESINNIKLLALIALRGAFDNCELTWKSDYNEILQLLSRVAICNSVGTLLRLLSKDESVETPVNLQARSLIATLLDYENYSQRDIPFLQVRPLNTHIEYIWGLNTPYRTSCESHKLLIALKHTGCIRSEVIECAEKILQKEQPIWLVIDFENSQVAVEFHKEWAERKHVRLVHVLINAIAFKGQILKSFITCWSGGGDVNYQYMTVHTIEYISHVINIMKVITELRRIGAVAAQSVLKKFWFVKNRDVSWTMDSTR